MIKQNLENGTNEVSTNIVVIDDLTKRVYVDGEEINDNYVGIWTDGMRFIAIDTLHEIIDLLEYNRDGYETFSKEVHITLLNDIINTNYVEDVNWSYDEERVVFIKFATHSSLDIKTMIDLFNRKITKYEHESYLKESAKILVDILNMGIRYIDIDRILDSIYSTALCEPSGMKLGAYITSECGVVHIRRNGDLTEQIFVDCGVVTPDMKVTSNMLDKFFEQIDSSLVSSKA